MRRIISALLLSVSSVWAFAQGAKPIDLAPDAPDRHIVVPGDTLWGIAAKFLKDPYRWPEIWRLNPDEIRNPHRIYPGQVVVLDRDGDNPRLKLGRLVTAEPRIHTEEQKKEIAAIPQHAIRPFLSAPLVVEAGTLDKLPRIIATQEGRVMVGAGDVVYATGVKTKERNWQVFRAGRVLRNPDNKEDVLGHEAVFLGEAKLTREGEPATFEIVTSREEIGRNDLVRPAERPEIISHIPHAPGKDIRGRILHIYGGVGEGGTLSIVSISAGSREGLERGHVLAIDRAGARVGNRKDDVRETYTLPDERYGLLYIFRVFDRVAYGLVMSASRSVVEGDVVHTP